MADTSQDPSAIHAEGIQHIAANTAPPGTEDTSRGTEGGVGTGAESGGVSSSAYVQSPVPSSGSDLEQNKSQGGIVETVKSYIGLGGSGTGTHASETGQLGSTAGTRNPEDATTGTGIFAGVTGAASTVASAVGWGSGNQVTSGGLGTTSSGSDPAADTITGSSSTSSTTAGSTLESAKVKGQEDTAADTITGSSSTPSTAAGSALESAREKVQEVTNTPEHKPVTSGTDEDKPPQPAGGKPHKLENESAIPTAGGERLGEKHWGESGIVPDNPEPRASAAGISSEAGQPTQLTTDNTAKNTGGASGPPVSSNIGSNGGGHGEEKVKMTDKIKDKLHIGSKKE